MKSKIILLTLAIVIFSFGSLMAELDEAYERDFMQRLEELSKASGEDPAKTTTHIHDVNKCGTNFAYEYYLIKDKLSAENAAKAAKVMARPTMAFTYDTPGGHFKIHYNTSGSDQVYMASTDDNSNGVPDYIDGIAEAADSSWYVEIDLLGYPVPPSDGVEGGDSRVDIYVYAIPSSFYGWTAMEDSIAPFSGTTYLVLDNDYGGISPYNQSSDIDRRLDAARVTIAHEFFHVIHFGMDFSEYEYQGGDTPQDIRRPWWEMSATWMEDVVFDSINDYYLYLDFFFEYPHIGLKDGRGALELHQYASAIFPMFLAEKFDASIVKDIWERCRDYGEDMQFELSINDAIEHYTGYDTTLDTSLYKGDSLGIGDTLVVQPYDLRTLMAEFAVWNYFTGTRAADAPPGIGYEEAANMAMFPDSVILSVNEYYQQNLLCPRQDTLVDGSDISHFNQKRTQNLGVEYLELNNIWLSGLDSVILFNAELESSYGFVGIPNQGGYDPTVRYYDADESLLFLKHDFENNQIYSRYIVPLIPATVTDLTYSETHCTVVIFESDSTTIPSSGIASIKAPYPNPKIMDGDNDEVVFEGDFSKVQSPGKMAQLFVTIFTTAGEKVIELQSPLAEYDNGSFPTVSWDPNYNNIHYDKDGATTIGGKAVAPGVYLALCQLVFSDGTETVTEKYKIAIIK